MILDKDSRRGEEIAQLVKAGSPFVCMRNVCITYVAYKYVTVNTFNAIKVFEVVQWGRDVNLIT